MNIEDEILLPQHNRIDTIQGNANNLLQTSMVGGVSQHNETALFDEEFAAGFINEMHLNQDLLPSLIPRCSEEASLREQGSSDFGIMI